MKDGQPVQLWLKWRIDSRGERADVSGALPSHALCYSLHKHMRCLLHACQQHDDAATSVPACTQYQNASKVLPGKNSSLLRDAYDAAEAEGKNYRKRAVLPPWIEHGTLRLRNARSTTELRKHLHDPLPISRDHDRMWASLNPSHNRFSLLQR